MFEAVKLSKNPDPNKYGHRGYGVGFDARSQFLLPIGEWGKNVIIFCVNNSLSKHTDNRKKDILTLGKGPAYELDDTTITAETKFSINIIRSILQVLVFSWDDFYISIKSM